MADLRVSYSTLDGVHHALSRAAQTFAASAVPRDGGAFGAEDVTQAFATFRRSQERADEWLANTSRTLAQYARDTRSLVQDADELLAATARGTG